MGMNDAEDGVAINDAEDGVAMKDALRVHWIQHVPFEGLGSIEAWLTGRGARVAASRM